MQINHYFKTTCHNLEELFNKVNTLSKFMTNLEKQSLYYPDNYDPLKYLGDGFEFFIELFLKLHPVDNRLLSDYQPNLNNDNGVDGTCLNIKGEQSVVQIKYRSNNHYLLSTNEDHLSNFITDAMANFNVVFDNKQDNNYRHFIFTTAKGLNFYTDNEMFKNKVKCYGYNEIKSLVDYNYGFWKAINDFLKTI